MKVPFRWILFSLVAFMPAAAAAERMAMENGAWPKAEQNLPSIPFRTMILESSTLTSEPGSILTRGGNNAGMMLPYLLAVPKPVQYPRWAMTHGWEGEFVIAVEVLIDGTVGRTKTMKSTGHHLLDEVATAAISTWRFHPAMKDGKPIRTCIELPVTFQLGSE